MSVVDQVRNIIATSIKLSAESVASDASMESLAGWDSIAHVNILMSIEQTFDLYFDAEEFSELVSIAEIVSRIERDGNNA